MVVVVRVAHIMPLRERASWMTRSSLLLLLLLPLSEWVDTEGSCCAASLSKRRKEAGWCSPEGERWILSAQEVGQYMVVEACCATARDQ
jgi:hypothetical protein